MFFSSLAATLFKVNCLSFPCSQISRGRSSSSTNAHRCTWDRIIANYRERGVLIIEVRQRLAQEIRDGEVGEGGLFYWETSLAWRLKVDNYLKNLTYLLYIMCKCSGFM